MGFLSKPKAPDSSELARQQGAANKETAIAQAGLNMVNQNSPGGSLTYNQIGKWEDGTPRYEATQSLSPEQRALYDQTNRIGAQYGNTAESQMGAVSGRLSQPFSTEQAGFNERDYLAANPDVAQAVQNGSMSAWDHYQRHGQNENRQGTGEIVRSLDMSRLPALQSGAQQGQIWNAINPAGDIQNSFADVGQSQRTIGDTGPIARGVENAGDINRNIADTGSQMRTFGDVGTQQRGLDFSAFGDPNISRGNVESALFERMRPQLEQDRSALETKLANQGLTPGTQAYDQAIDQFNRQVNDARLATVANAGNEQSRIFGLGLQQGQFANQGQERDYAQALGRASFWNSGQAQDFGQATAKADFANRAQQQQYGQNLNDAQFANQAQRQAFDEAMAQQDAFNRAQAQDYSQAQGRATFSNQAQGQQYDQNANNAAFFNAAQQQQFQQDMANANLANQARAQGMNENLTAANFQNTGRQNAINEQILGRQQPLNELAALLSGIQMQGPSFVNTPATNVQGTDVMTPAMMQYQQQMQARNAGLGGLAGLGGALGGGYLASGGRFW